MKTTEKMTDSVKRMAPESRFDLPQKPLFRDQRSLIQWNTEEQIREVSKTLATINQFAIRLEADGDYFRSGDLAYQIQEIIRSTQELFKKTQRDRVVAVKHGSSTRNRK